MELAVSQHDGVTVVQPAETRLDARAAVVFKDRMKHVIEAGQDRVVLTCRRWCFWIPAGWALLWPRCAFCGRGRCWNWPG